MTDVYWRCWAVPSLDYVDMHSSTRVPGKAAMGSDTHVAVRLKTPFRLLIGRAESRQYGYTWRLASPRVVVLSLAFGPWGTCIMCTCVGGKDRFSFL